MTQFLLIASDIHSDSEGFEKLVSLASDKNCLSVIYCGDLNIENWEISEAIRNRNFSFLPVLGNCDSPWSWTDLALPTPPLFRKVEFFKTRIFVSHGHYYQSPSDAGLNDEDFDIIINGHTHVPYLEKKQTQVYLNPGSLSYPRGNSEMSYAKIEFNQSVVIKLCRLRDNCILSELIIPLNK